MHNLVIVIGGKSLYWSDHCIKRHSLAKTYSHFRFGTSLGFEVEQSLCIALSWHTKMKTLIASSLFFPQTGNLYRLKWLFSSSDLRLYRFNSYQRWSLKSLAIFSQVRLPSQKLSRKERAMFWQQVLARTTGNKSWQFYCEKGLLSTNQKWSLTQDQTIYINLNTAPTITPALHQWWNKMAKKWRIAIFWYLKKWKYRFPFPKSLQCNYV